MGGLEGPPMPPERSSRPGKPRRPSPTRRGSAASNRAPSKVVLGGFPGFADRTGLETLVAGFGQRLEVLAIELRDALRPRAVATVEDLRTATGAEGLARILRSDGLRS